MNLNLKESLNLAKEEEAKIVEKLLYFEGSIEDDISKETIELLKIRFEEIGEEYSPMYKLGMQFMLLSMGQLQVIYNGIPTLSAFNTENKNVHYVTDSKKMIDYLLSIGSREIEFIVKVSLAEMIKNDEIQKNAWKNGDEKALYDNLMSYYSEYDFEVIGYFNDLYMEVINREIQNTNRLFVISRVEQLILRNSLINRLKKEGYKIERINK